MRAGIEIDAQAPLVSRGVTTVGAALAGVAGLVATFEPRTASDTEASVSPRNVKEAGAIGATDADVLDGDSLIDRQVCGMGCPPPL
ncbi:hypothetical protein JCM16408A_18810 [Methylobacterium phyllosphaerae]